MSNPFGALASAPNGFDLAAGLDLVRFDPRGDGFVSVLITPRGPQLFAGRTIFPGLAFGGIAKLSGRNHFGLGVFWSVVL